MKQEVIRNGSPIYNRGKDDKLLSNVIGMVILGVFLTNVSFGIGRFFGVSYTTVSLMGKVVIALSLVRAVLVFINRFNRTMLIGIFIYFITCLLQILLFPKTIQFYIGVSASAGSTLVTFSVTVFPAILTFCIIEDYQVLLRQMQRIAVVVSVLTLILIVGFGGDAFEKYSMGFAGAMILPSILMMTLIMTPNSSMFTRLIYLGLELVDVFAVMMYGSRGAFLAIALFMAYCLLRQTAKKSITLAVILAIIFVFFLMYYKELFKFLANYVSKLGYSSRTLMSLSKETVSDSGRSELYDVIIAGIKQNPLLFRGINADYNVLGVYCHNWFLEILYNFGVPIGMPICIVIIVTMIKVLFVGFKDSRSIIHVCLTFAFFPVCLFSSSVWLSTWFWSWVVISATSRANRIRVTEPSQLRKKAIDKYKYVIRD